MRSGSLLALSRTDVEPLVSLKEAIPVLEKALADLAAGQARLFPVIRERIDPYGGFFGIKAAYLQSQGYLGYKGGGFWKDNRSRGIAGHQSVILLYDPATGVPLAVMDGNYLTVVRTGAVGAIATKYLARADSRIVAVVGCGVQGRIQLDALRQVLNIEQVRCCGRTAESTRAFAAHCARIGVDAAPCGSVREAMQHADVVVTATPSFQPLVENAWVDAGVHINAIGADTEGKQEVDQHILGPRQGRRGFLAPGVEAGGVPARGA